MDKVTTKRFQLTRDVSCNECQWLDRDFKKGEIVFEYPLYIGGVTRGGVACSEKDCESPFFELPKDALKEICTEKTPPSK